MTAKKKPSCISEHGTSPCTIPLHEATNTNAAGNTLRHIGCCTTHYNTPHRIAQQYIVLIAGTSDQPDESTNGRNIFNQKKAPKNPHTQRTHPGVVGQRVLLSPPTDFTDVKSPLFVPSQGSSRKKQHGKAAPHIRSLPPLTSRCILTHRLSPSPPQ